MTLNGDPSLFGTTGNYQMNIDVYVGAGMDSFYLDDFTVEWLDADKCNYSYFDPDPLAQTFAFTQYLNDVGI